MEWNATDETSEIVYQSWFAGTLPFASDIKNETVQDNGKVPLGFYWITTRRKPFFFTIKAIDSSGNIATTVSPSLTIDTTKPISWDDLDCTPFISSVNPMIYCKWSDLLDHESPIYDTAVSVGLSQLDDSLIAPIHLAHGTTFWATSLHYLFDGDYPEVTYIYVTVQTVNDAGLVSALIAKITIDVTPPEYGSVEIITSLTGETAYSRQCQQSTTFLQLAVDGFKEDISAIHRCIYVKFYPAYWAMLYVRYSLL